MKILSIGYYDDFARFFLKIKEELQAQDETIEFKYYSLFLSGYVYWILKSKSSMNISWISMKAYILSLKNKKKYNLFLSKGSFLYKGIHLEKIIEYHTKSGVGKQKKLLSQAMAYIDIFDAQIQNYAPDVLILSGDSRMSVEILNCLAKKYQIKTYYFEQGPFGTTILDELGVNANASIRYTSIESMRNSLLKKDNQEPYKTQVYRRFPLFRGSDYIFNFFKLINIVPEDILIPSSVKINKKIVQILTTSLSWNIEEKKENVVLLILQVPFDVNMIYHSPFYSNHTEIVKDIFNNLPKDKTLVIREHPLYKGKYQEQLYSFMLENNILYDGNELSTSLEAAEFIIVNNSTVGIEAMSKRKKVLILGNCYYDNHDLGIKYNGDLKDCFDKLRSFQPDKERFDVFMSYFKTIFLIQGHYRDHQLVAPKLISNIIIDAK